jgi:hypothetical protein
MASGCVFPAFALAEKNTSRNGILPLPPEKENRIAVSSIVSAGNVGAFMSVRPQSAAVAAALPATIAGFFGSSAMRRWPRTS